jgi:class II lanthipeptide synthase
VSTRSSGGGRSPLRRTARGAGALTSSADIFCAAACDLGDRLVRRAVWNAGQCTWTADQIDIVDDEWALVHISLDASLYSGTTGIARFLIYLWQVVRGKAYRETALGALARSWADLESRSSTQRGGLFTGSLGTALVTVEAGHVLGRDDLTARGLEIGRGELDTLAQSREATAFDLMDGAAGTLVGGAFLARVDRSGRCAAACREISQSLVAAGRQSSWGMSWSDPASGNEALCGLAHGASGAALGLLEAWHITGDAALLDVAREAMRFEQAWFNQSRGDWRDNRQAVISSDEGGDATAPFWCHGAAGIGLARLRGYQLTRDLTMVAEAGAALRSASEALQLLKQNGLSPDDTAIHGNFSVCHGVGSLIELHTCAAEMLEQPIFLERARSAMQAVLSAVWRAGYPWRCGVSGGDEHPGLMLGLSGIGMCLLRLHAPGTVPPASLVIGA